MVKKIVRYRIKPAAAAVVTEAIAEFVDAVTQHEPDTIYGSLAADDGVSFFHAMAFPDETAERRHAQAEYTRRFVDLLSPLCEAPPTFTDVRVIRTTKQGGGFLGMG